MPIYAYKCAACGFSKDVLQKLSDDPLSDCPSCAAPSFQKQLTAAGFQLKGSGWYVTDFKGGKAPAVSAPETKSDDAPSGAGAAATETKGAESKGVKAEAAPSAASAEAAASRSSAAAPAAAPAMSQTSAPASVPARPSQS